MVQEEIVRFSKIVSLSEEKNVRMSATKNLVEMYQKTIEFTQKIEYIYSYQLLVQVILSTLEICATGFTFITVSNNIIRIELIFHSIFLNCLI